LTVEYFAVVPGYADECLLPGVDESAWVTGLEDPCDELCLIDAAEETLLDGKVERWTEETDWEWETPLLLPIEGAEECLEDDACGVDLVLERWGVIEVRGFEEPDLTLTDER
jgi:hypothetical protein